MTDVYPIGVAGQPWTAEHKRLWLQQQRIQRSYQQQVLDKLKHFSELFEVVQYGALDVEAEHYPLFILKSHHWQHSKPTILVTGGVHGYETSGVQGALSFAAKSAGNYVESFNILVAPCISPWGYETINRWNAAAIDPNRSFYQNSPAPEAQQLMSYVQSLSLNILAHFDLHETTDTDNSEFRPALAARDAIPQKSWNIPDGFYTVADAQKPAPEFQQAIIEEVEKVTHIAPADEQREIIGSPLQQKGVINYEARQLGLCAGFTNAKYVTTTEVYPDSANATAEICVQAQVAAIVGGLNYLLRLI